MKKRLEADLVSIAHRILRLKSKSDVNVLLLETQKLYEKLAILKFIEDNFDDVKPTIGRTALEEELEKTFLKNETNTENSAPESPSFIEISQQEIKETPATIVANLFEKATSEASILETITNELEPPSLQEALPNLEAAILEEKTQEQPNTSDTNTPPLAKEKTTEVVQISFEELLGGNYADTQFVKVDAAATSKINPPVVTAFDLAFDKVETVTEESEIKPKSLNEKLGKGISIDLNDRIGFVKHLFNNSNEDYNRVLSQLNSFNNFYETKTFIDEMIKPEYNNWEGKDNYANRFMEMVEKKFL